MKSDSNLNIVLISDEYAIRSLITAVLRNIYKNASIIQLPYISEAHCSIDEKVPDIIILDVSNNCNESCDLVDALRANVKSSHVKIIALANKTDNDAEELRLYRCGFSLVLTKPFHIQQLIIGNNKLLGLHDDPNISLLLAGRERQDIDYKGIIHISDKDARASLAKDVIAMSNWGGGTIFIGVSEPTPGIFEYGGLPDGVLDQYETTRLNRAIRAYIDPPLHVASTYLKYDKKNFVMLSIPPSEDVLILPKKKNDNAQLYPGRIYTRNTSAESAEVQNSSELREIIRRICKK